MLLSAKAETLFEALPQAHHPLTRQEIPARTAIADTVYNALNLSNPTTGAQPDRIRRRAMELGGKENRKIRWINY